MLGLMQDRPLLIQQLIATPTATTATPRSCRARSKGRSTATPIAMRTRAAQAARPGAAGARREAGDRVGTLAWNGYRHFELYYGVSGIGAVCHTINPRLFPEQIVYIVNHAEDRLLFFDLNFAAAGREAAPQLQDRCGTSWR